MPIGFGGRRSCHGPSLVEAWLQRAGFLAPCAYHLGSKPGCSRYSLTSPILPKRCVRWTVATPPRLISWLIFESRAWAWGCIDPEARRNRAQEIARCPRECLPKRGFKCKVSDVAVAVASACGPFWGLYDMGLAVSCSSFIKLSRLHRWPTEPLYLMQEALNAQASASMTLYSLVLSREWGNGLWGLLKWGLYRDYYRDPFPHSLLSTRQSRTRLVTPTLAADLVY